MKLNHVSVKTLLVLHLTASQEPLAAQLYVCATAARLSRAQPCVNAPCLGDADSNCLLGNCCSVSDPQSPAAFLASPPEFIQTEEEGHLKAPSASF